MLPAESNKWSQDWEHFRLTEKLYPVYIEISGINIFDSNTSKIYPNTIRSLRTQTQNSRVFDPAIV